MFKAIGPGLTFLISKTTVFSTILYTKEQKDCFLAKEFDFLVLLSCLIIVVDANSPPYTLLSLYVTARYIVGFVVSVTSRQICFPEKLSKGNWATSVNAGATSYVSIATFFLKIAIPAPYGSTCSNSKTVSFKFVESAVTK